MAFSDTFGTHAVLLPDSIECRLLITLVQIEGEGNQTFSVDRGVVRSCTRAVCGIGDTVAALFAVLLGKTGRKREFAKSQPTGCSGGSEC